ncbi:MAG: cyclic nucleotide-binding domain-containing protein [Desulfuromonas sp.]|nr:cyclic nucleotide-binding domain-containing protein [Desulfuromonas sp.]
MILAPQEDQCVQMKRDFHFFHFLDQNDIDLLTPYFNCRCLQPGEDLWVEGENSKFVAFITSGRIEGKKETAFRNKQVVVGVYGKESLLGVFSLLSEDVRPVTATALEESRVLLLDKQGFDEINKLYPALGGRLMKGMLFCVTMRLRQSYQRLAAIF